MENPIKIAVSSGCLFDLRQINNKLERLSPEDRSDFLSHSHNAVLEKGAAYQLVKKLNDLVVDGRRLVEVCLVSRKGGHMADLIRGNLSLADINLSEIIFTDGAGIIDCVTKRSIDLFLSTKTCDVRDALSCHIPAAKLLPNFGVSGLENQIRIAFDGDSVIFDDKVDRIFEKHGIDAVHDHEKKMNHIPINPGPLQSFFEKVHTAKKAINLVKPGTLKTAIITARSRSVGKRVRQTIEGWNLSESVDRIDFMSGACKTSAIERFCTDIFFDDRMDNCRPASSYSSVAHVPWGIANALPHDEY
tara:strand:- start:448 stop:1356 length:909 start_codon:yes stop_codon:yes gene_type:complete